MSASSAWKTRGIILQYATLVNHAKVRKGLDGDMLYFA